MDLVALAVTGVLVILAVVTRCLVDRVGPGNRTRPDVACPQGWGHHPHQVDPVSYDADGLEPGATRTRARHPEGGQDITPHRTIVALSTGRYRDQRPTDPLNSRVARLPEQIGDGAVTAEHVTCSCRRCPTRGAWWSSQAGGPG